jgi:hypothetical protein
MTVLQVQHSAQSAINVVEKPTGDFSGVVAQVGLVERDQRGDVHATSCRPNESNEPWLDGKTNRASAQLSDKHLECIDSKVLG